MTRWIVFAFGVLAYVAGVRSLLYFIGFSSNLVVSRTVDSGPVTPWPAALAVDVALLLIFALSHSLMARPAFKRALTRYLPEAVERSLYVLVSAASLTLLMWQWRPISAPVWDLQATGLRYALLALSAVGWVLAGVSFFSVGHLELFGLRQARGYALGRAPSEDQLVTTGIYRYLRNPMFVGFTVAIWSVARMSVGHLLLAIGMSAYLLVGAHYERRDLIDRFGIRYLAYVAGRGGASSRSVS